MQPNLSTADRQFHHLLDEPNHASALALINQIPVDTFEAHTFEGPVAPRLQYRLLRPLESAAGKTYPLVIVLHGAGEMGTDNLKHMDLLVKNWAQENRRANFPAFVVAPQMPERSARYDKAVSDPNRRSQPGPAMTALLALIDSLIATLSIDAARIYWVGYSMGGSTTWNALALRPDIFTAGVVYCGVPTGLPLPTKLPPLWLVHGCLDIINPIAPTRTMFEQLQAHHAPIRYWEYDDLGHSPPPDLQVGTTVPQWLFSHISQKSRRYFTCNEKIGSV